LLSLWLFLIISVAYFLVASVLAVARNKFPPQNPDYLPFVSVVISARNEGSTIGPCLDSLFAQDYPEDFFEVIAVDDRSSDNSPEIMESYRRRYPRLKVITIRKEPEALTGKQVAMDVGINRARGEIIMTTDGDCLLPPGWISETVRYFSPEVGMVAGFSRCGFGSLFSGIQSCDHIFLEGVASAFVTLGNPQSCIGNNLSFRKEIYQSLGGFKEIGFTVTEDTALMQGIFAQTGSKILFPQNHRTLVVCEAARNLGDLFRQRKRWLLGGIKTSLPTSAMTIIAFLRNLLFVLSPLFLIFHLSTALLICAWILIFASDFLILFKHRALLGTGKLLTYYLPFQLFYPFYTSVLGLSVIFSSKKVHWKEREYTSP
jgi:cellulose synthase/poly-beta-1,6-N-acetylglucosamine synthase-like glycosyltransferase